MQNLQLHGLATTQGRYLPFRGAAFIGIDLYQKCWNTRYTLHLFHAQNTDHLPNGRTGKIGPLRMLSSRAIQSRDGHQRHERTETRKIGSSSHTYKTTSLISAWLIFRLAEGWVHFPGNILTGFWFVLPADTWYSSLTSICQDRWHLVW